MRNWWWLVACWAVVGCQSVEKASVQPLTPGGPPLTYDELVQRGKNQVTYAHESFYKDDWDEVKRAALAMRETATHLASLNLDSVPAAKRAQFAKLSKEWGDAAATLQDSGQAKDPEKTSAAFTKLHLVIRRMFVE